MSIAFAWKKMHRKISKHVHAFCRQMQISSATKAYIRDCIFERVPQPFLKYSGRYCNWKMEKRITSLYKKAEDCSSWGIMVPHHSLFIAMAIELQLQEHGYDVNIFTNPPDEFSQDFYIVISPQIFKRLPPYEKLISFQAEQILSSSWFAKKHLDILYNSHSVLEHATHNLPFLHKMKIYFPHVHYLPFCGLASYGNTQPQVAKTYDVLFYGNSFSSLIQERMLSELEKYFDVFVTYDTSSSPMERMIQSARVVISLRHCKDGLLEVPRIWKCLSLGVPVVSETPRDQEDYPELKDVVTFFEQGSVASMLSSVEDTLRNPPSKQEIFSAIAASRERFSFMFDRFLVATGFLPSSYIREMPIPVPLTNRIIISMPETFYTTARGFCRVYT